LETLRLRFIQREFDIAADSGIHAIDPVARGQALFELRASLPDNGSRRFGQLYTRFAASYIFHIFD